MLVFPEVEWDRDSGGGREEGGREGRKEGEGGRGEGREGGPEGGRGRGGREAVNGAEEKKTKLRGETTP